MEEEDNQAMGRNEKSILQRLFEIREELEKLVGKDDALYVLVNGAIDVASHREKQGIIPKQKKDDAEPRIPA